MSRSSQSRSLSQLPQSQRLSPLTYGSSVALAFLVFIADVAPAATPSLAAVSGRSCASHATYQMVVASIEESAEATGGNAAALTAFFGPDHAHFSDATVDAVDHSTGALTCSAKLQYDAVPLPDGTQVSFGGLDITYRIQPRADGLTGEIVRLQGPPQIAALIASTANSVAMYKGELQFQAARRAAGNPVCGDGTYSCKYASSTMQAAAGYHPKPETNVSGEVEWLREPSGDDLAELYPHEAQRRGLAGQTVVSCVVMDDQHLGSCTIVAENPLGEGFGQAALLMMHRYIARDRASTGRTVILRQDWRLQ